MTTRVHCKGSPVEHPGADYVRSLWLTDSIARSSVDRSDRQQPAALAERSSVEQYAAPITSRCCLCGSSDTLSGEHKIKASALRSIFGSQSTLIGHPGGPYRHAQSPKSKAFHFTSRLCEPCNSARTRPGDLAFDEFNEKATSLSHQGLQPSLVFCEQRFNPNSGHLYTDVCRHFAKHMCCHLAEMGAPPLSGLADFAVGTSSRNMMTLLVDHDVGYQRREATHASGLYAAHGGLLVIGNSTTHAPTCFHSTLTVGPVRYCYRVWLDQTAQAQLLNDHPEFYAWCARRTAETLQNPMSSEDRELLGVAPLPTP